MDDPDFSDSDSDSDDGSVNLLVDDFCDEDVTDCLSYQKEGCE